MTQNWIPCSLRMPLPDDYKVDATAIEAEPVVRCEFCEKYGKALDCPYSASTGVLPDPQDYCSMGVRKKDGTN